MLSRVADTIYWMNRYLERVENYARFMDVNYNLSLEMYPNISEQWKPLVVTTGDWDLYESNYGKANKKKIIYFLTFDDCNENSILSCITKARENARSVRPEITKELWEQINDLYFRIQEGAEKKIWEKNDPRIFFSRIKEKCQLINGIYDTTISRNEAWNFAKLGQFIERADKTAIVLDVKYHMLLPNIKAVGTPIDLLQWSALLKSVSAYDMYRRKYGKINPTSICEFLIFDKTFPRSIMSCVENAYESLLAISGKDDLVYTEAYKQLGILKSSLEYTNAKAFLEEGLHDKLEEIKNKLDEISKAIYDTYFSTDNILNSYQNQ